MSEKKIERFWFNLCTLKQLVSDFHRQHLMQKGLSLALLFSELRHSLVHLVLLSFAIAPSSEFICRQLNSSVGWRSHNSGECYQNGCEECNEAHLGSRLDQELATCFKKPSCNRTLTLFKSAKCITQSHLCSKMPSDKIEHQHMPSSNKVASLSILVPGPGLLVRAQQATKTLHGMPVSSIVVDHILTQAEIVTFKSNRELKRPMFLDELSLITDHLGLTGLAGFTVENIGQQFGAI